MWIVSGICYFLADTFNCNNYTFFLIAKKTKFEDAVTFCQRIGSGWNLAMPSTEEERQCMKENINRYPSKRQRATVWIGYNSSETGVWKDLYGMETVQMNWETTNSPLQADNDKLCAILRFVSGFRQIGCNSLRPFMCQQCEFC